MIEFDTQQLYKPETKINNIRRPQLSSYPIEEASSTYSYIDLYENTNPIDFQSFLSSVKAAVPALFGIDLIQQETKLEKMLALKLNDDEMVRIGILVAQRVQRGE